MYKIIDVSKHQGTFNPVIAAAKGIDGVIVRLAYGTTVDGSALCWCNGIRNTGMKLGGYGFATWHYQSVCGGDVNRARAAMQKQVTTWIETAKKNGINWWLAIDQELEAGNSMALTMDDNTRIINEAADMIIKAGFPCLLYCSVAWDYSNIHTAILDERVKYWFAYYGNAVRDKWFDQAKIEALPAGKYRNWMDACKKSSRLAGWQFGSTYWGNALGAGSTHIDRNIFWLDADVNAPVKMHKIHTGPMTEGDMLAVTQMLKDRQLTYEVE